MSSDRYIQRYDRKGLFLPHLSQFPAAVIFDMDGTLLDTEAKHGEMMAAASQNLGWPISQEIFLRMVGVHRDENRRMLAEEYGPDFPVDQFYIDSETMFEAAIENGIPLRPGALEIIAYLHAMDIPMAVATSTLSPYAERRLEQASILPFLQTVVTRSDVERAKPDPECYLLAADRLGIAPALCLAVEDSPIGARAAHGAGMTTIMIPDLLPPTREIAAMGIAILNGLSDLQQRLGNLER